MNKTQEYQKRASKRYRERQKALGMVTVRISLHRSLVSKFKKFVEKFKEDNKRYEGRK